MPKLILKKVFSFNQLSEFLSEALAKKYCDRLNEGTYKTEVEIDFDIKNMDKDDFVKVEVFTKTMKEVT